MFGNRTKLFLGSVAKKPAGKAVQIGESRFFQEVALKTNRKKLVPGLPLVAALTLALAALSSPVVAADPAGGTKAWVVSDDAGQRLLVEGE